MSRKETMTMSDRDVSLREQYYRMYAEQEVAAREERLLKEMGYEKKHRKLQLIHLALESDDPFIAEALDELLLRVKMVTPDLPPDPYDEARRSQKAFLEAASKHISIREKMRIACVDYGTAVSDLVDEWKKNGR